MTSGEYGEKIKLRRRAKATLLQEKYANATTLLTDLQARSLALEEAQVFLQGVAKETQEQIRFNIEDIVKIRASMLYSPVCINLESYLK